MLYLYVDEETRISGFMHVVRTWRKKAGFFPLHHRNPLHWMFWMMSSSFPPLRSLLSLPDSWRATMSEDPASSSEQNNSSYQTKVSNLRMSDKKCCKFWPKGGLHSPRILSWEYTCNPRLCCLVGVRSNSLTWGLTTKTTRGVPVWKSRNVCPWGQPAGGAQPFLRLSLPESLSPVRICALVAKS